MANTPQNPADDETAPHIDQPQRLCNAIVELIEVLKENDLLDEENASEIRTDIYSSVELVNLPEEEK